MTQTEAVVRTQEVRVSADSHMAEPFDLWETRLPKDMQERGLRFPGRKYGEFQHTRAGGWDPRERLSDMAADGVVAEVLYPTLASGMFRMDDHALEHSSARVYNDWLIEFCQEAPDRLWGLAAIPLWDIDHAVRELERCHKAGMAGSIIWMRPPDELPFSSDHYDRFWAASQDLGMPVNMHINLGHGPYKSRPPAGPLKWCD